jgi:hypothetical protein
MPSDPRTGQVGSGLAKQGLTGSVWARNGTESRETMGRHKSSSRQKEPLTAELKIPVHEWRLFALCFIFLAAGLILVSF